MTIETICPGCGRKLRVASEHAGKQARCPLCNAIYTVTETGPRGAEAAEIAAEASSWRMRTPEGQTYGPVAKRELDRWVGEGRVTANCELQAESTGQWQAAEAVYTVLRPQTTVGSSQPQAAERPSRYRYTEPHRGVLILVLGILSWVVSCPVFGIAAWVLGSADLREMRAGRMDPSGMGVTQAGQMLGMIHAIILIVLMVVAVFVLVAGVAVR